MENWKRHLTPEEAERYEALRLASKANTKERGKIYDRCRKRMERGNAEG